MNTAVAEPLQSVIEHFPPIQLPQGLVEYLPERFQPEKRSRSRKPLLLALLVIGGAIVFFAMRRRSGSNEETAAYDGLTPTTGDSPFVDVR